MQLGTSTVAQQKAGKQAISLEHLRRFLEIEG